MKTEDRGYQNALKHHGDLGNGMCCVYWCREQAVITIELNDRHYGCCRKHAAFIKAGKLDWFER